MGKKKSRSSRESSSTPPSSSTPSSRTLILLLTTAVVALLIALFLVPKSNPSPPPTTTPSLTEVTVTSRQVEQGYADAAAKQAGELLAQRGESALRLEDLAWMEMEEIAVGSGGVMGKKDVDALMARRVPGVIRGAGLGSGWTQGVMETWTPETVAAQAGVLTNVLANSTRGKRFFYVDNLKPMLEDVDEVSWIQPYQVLEEVNASDFLSLHAHKREEDIPHGHQMYMSRKVRELSSDLRDQLNPFSDILPDDAKPVVVWLSSPGVTAHLHHDNSDNLFVQVYGSKRFLIVDPVAWDDLYMFSSLHPATRQSQVDIEALDPSAFPNVFRSLPLAGMETPEGYTPRGYMVTLHPGDMLWLPAYWLHHPSAIGFSVSVMSFVSPRHKEIVKTATYGEPLPLNVEPKSKQLLTLWLWLSLVIDGVETKAGIDVTGQLSLNRVVASGSSYISSLVGSRWSHLKDDAMLLNAQVLFPPQDKVSPKYCLGNSRSDLLIHGGPHTALLQHATRVAEQFNRLEAGVRDIALASYVEALANHFVGTRDVAPFFTQCFLRPMER